MQQSIVHSTASILKAAKTSQLLRAEKDQSELPEVRKVITMELNARGELDRPF